MLKQFANEFILKIEGTYKDAYIDTYEHGEGDGVSYQLDYVDGEFALNGNESKEELTETVVKHLRDKLGQGNIDKGWIAINGRHITLSMHENADGYPINDVKKYWDEGKDVYSCYYSMRLYINGRQLEENQLIELFDFEY